ncbi:MAG: hypothetical protein OXB84_00405 [Halobacteriovoraceae bacterium]|nr:hypothetical protein [Halobacteriovoraceae bacterium]
MIHTHKRPRREAGQSTIEFLFGLIFIFAFVFTFIKMAFNYTDGFMIHYATFMASRSYLVYDDNTGSTNEVDEKALRHANAEVFKKHRFTDRINADFQVNSPTDPNNKLYTGGYSTFKQVISIIDFLGGRKEVDLKSEAFLGREPIRLDCLDRICQMMDSTVGGVCTKGKHTTFFDNGC